MLREVYGELDRAVTDPECPIRSWRDAVSPAADVGLAEWEGPTWSHFVTQFSGNDAIPGEPEQRIDRFNPWTWPLAPCGSYSTSIGRWPHDGRLPRSMSVALLCQSRSLRLGDTRSGAGLTALAALLEAVERGARLTTGLGHRLVEALAAVLQRWRDGMRRVSGRSRGLTDLAASGSDRDERAGHGGRRTPVGHWL